MAPTASAWARMSAKARAEVVASLPASLTEAELSPPEGDLHLNAKIDARDALRAFFKGRGKSLYVGCELTVYYPGKRRFAPDIFVVFDVAGHDREKWVVSAEGKGLDFVLEVHVGGDRKKDYVSHPVFYTSLGIPEYFVFDRAQNRLHGWRLAAPDATSYVPILAQYGRYASHALGLELCLEGHDLRFYAGNAPLLHTSELMQRLHAALGEAQAMREDVVMQLATSEAARQAEAEARQAEAEARQAEVEARQAEAEARRTEAEARQAAEAEIARLRQELERLRRN